MNLYRCKHCKKITRRDAYKAWIKSFCEEKGRMTRLMRYFPRPTMRQQNGRAVVELMVDEGISFGEMALAAGLTHNKLWWFLIGDERAYSKRMNEELDLLDNMSEALGSYWTQPRFVKTKE